MTQIDLSSILEDRGLTLGQEFAIAAAINDAKNHLNDGSVEPVLSLLEATIEAFMVQQNVNKRLVSAIAKNEFGQKIDRQTKGS